MAKISNVNVYGLAESIFRSGYPMLTRPPDESKFEETTSQIKHDIIVGRLDNNHIRRAIKLANISGGGHDQFLTGIVVNFDLMISNKAWVEAERYTFLNFISSMSTMHRISEIPISECCNTYTSVDTVRRVEKLQAEYQMADDNMKPEAYLTLLYNLPSGFELTAGMTTNYRCLKNIYAQRRGHRLPDWSMFCDWIETLPLASFLITGGATTR